MYCLNCNNDGQTQKASSIFLAGTSETHSSGSSNTTFNQSGFNQNNNQNQSAYTRSSSYSFSQTALAKLCSPPRLKLNPFLLFLIFVVAGFFFKHPFDSSIFYSKLLTPIIFIIPIPFVYYNSKWNKNIYPLIYEQWESKWYCHKCDLFF